MTLTDQDSDSRTRDAEGHNHDHRDMPEVTNSIAQPTDDATKVTECDAECRDEQGTRRMPPRIAPQRVIRELDIVAIPILPCDPARLASGSGAERWVGVGFDPAQPPQVSPLGVVQLQRTSLRLRVDNRVLG